MTARVAGSSARRFCSSSLIGSSCSASSVRSWAESLEAASSSRRPEAITILLASSRSYSLLVHSACGSSHTLGGRHRTGADGGADGKSGAPGVSGVPGLAAPTAGTASPAPLVAGHWVYARAGSNGSSVCAVPCCAAPSVTSSWLRTVPGTVELPGDLAADRGRPRSAPASRPCMLAVPDSSLATADWEVPIRAATSVWDRPAAWRCSASSRTSLPRSPAIRAACATCASAERRSAISRKPGMTGSDAPPSFTNPPADSDSTTDPAADQPMRPTDPAAARPMQESGIRAANCSSTFEAIQHRHTARRDGACRVCATEDRRMLSTSLTGTHRAAALFGRESLSTQSRGRESLSTEFRSVRGTNLSAGIGSGVAGLG